MRHRSPRLVVAMTLILIAAAAAAAAAAAEAEPGGFVQGETHSGFLYANFGAEGSVSAGGPLELSCGGDGDVASAPLVVLERNDGSVDLMVDARNQPIWVYRSTLEAPVLVNLTCTAEIAPREAFATGSANLRVRITILGAGVQEASNGVNGKAALDGTHWKARTWGPNRGRWGVAR